MTFSRLVGPDCGFFYSLHGSFETTMQSPNYYTYKEPRNRFQGINSASLCILAGRYDNPLPTRFLAPIEWLKIPALAMGGSEPNKNKVAVPTRQATLCLALIDCSKNTQAPWGARDRLGIGLLYRPPAYIGKSVSACSTVPCPWPQSTSTYKVPQCIVPSSEFGLSQRYTHKTSGFKTSGFKTSGF